MIQADCCCKYISIDRLFLCPKFCEIKTLWKFNYSLDNPLTLQKRSSFAVKKPFLFGCRLLAEMEAGAEQTS